MKKSRIIAVVVLLCLAVLMNVLVLNYRSDFAKKTKTVYLDVESEQDIVFKLQYGSEEEAVYFNSKTSQGKGTVSFDVPLKYQDFVISTDSKLKENEVTDIYYNYYFMEVSLNEITETKTNKEGCVSFQFTNGVLNQNLNEVQHNFQKKMNVVFCVVLDIAVCIFAKYMFQLWGLFKELLGNRTMVMRLGKNDFKTRFAGSYLGIVWAFVQPVVTVMVYWFVFQVGFRSAPVGDFPFVLWLTIGIVPWFFFSEAWMSGTNSLVEYSYLVKKVVFNISTIPVVKIVSALFVHVFFVAFAMFLYVCYGYTPDLYWLQVLYYSFCLLVLILALVYLCCAIMVFFRDLYQIINVVLQVGIWLSGIMWSVDLLPEKIRWIIHFNPVYYVISGFRNSLIMKEWFWETPYQTIGYWSFVIVLLCVGVNVFNKLRVHFADVL